MKPKKTIPILLVSVLACALVFGHTRNACEDKVILYEHTIEPGRQWYEVKPYDANGNYKGNILKVKFHGDVVGLELGGLGIWEDDPNYFIILNATEDVDDPNKLSGSFQLGRDWGLGHYEIGIQVFDVVDHNDCKWLIVDVEDLTPPSTGGCSAL